ncbi:M3 family metallopeptidase, partial [Salmonella enterica subsp. enterica serovar Montevideo]|nr:M3 family metallopeptidase [Salmonella enterica subsp. enterica serovar Montevideo]
FVEQGGLTRENGQRFRDAILSRGNSTDLETLYSAWRGHEPHIRGIIIRADPFRRQWIGHTAFGCYHKASVNRVRNGFERRTP